MQQILAPNLAEFPTFTPHPLLVGGHLQTIGGQLLGANPRADPYEVEVLTLPDGDQVVLHINRPLTNPNSDLTRRAEKPIVLMLHGLGGCSESAYILRIARRLTKLGHVVVRFNHRGCGLGGAALARHIYHAGRGEDVAALIQYAHARWPHHPLLVAGFSLSANMLLRWLGQHDTLRVAPQLMGALAICPPIDLELCSRALARKDNWHIDRYYTRSLIRTARFRQRLFAGSETDLVFPPKMSLRLFDELYTAPRAGFNSRDDYYERSSARGSVHRIVTPTVVLAAADDPIIPAATFDRVNWSSAVTFRMERSGGHMGFISRRLTAWGDRRWMDAFVVEWVRGSLLAASSRSNTIGKEQSWPVQI